MLNILGIQTVEFLFPPSKTSSRTDTKKIIAPPGTSATQIYLKSFSAEYTNRSQFGYGRLAVSLDAVDTEVMECALTLRDNNVDEREWTGSVKALVLTFKEVAED